MTKILKGDASKEITLALADGYDYAGATVEVRYQGERFAFRDCRAGGSVSFRFTAEQTAPMALGAFPVEVRVGRPDGTWATFDNARVKIEVTDDPGEVNEGGVIALDVRGGLFGLSGLPARWTDADVREKVNEIIRRLGGTAAALALCALPAFGASFQSAPKAEVYSDAPVVTNVTFEGLATTAEVEAAVAAATNGLLRAESDPTVPAWAKATAKPKYTASEVGAYTKTQTDAAISSATGGLASVSSVASVSSALGDHIADDGNPHGVTAAQVGAYTKAEADAKVAAATPADYANVSNRAMSAVQPAALAPYAKRDEIPSVPTNVSALTNDAEYITKSDVLPSEITPQYAAAADYASFAGTINWSGVAEVPDFALKSEVAAATNGLLRAESDPTVPAWAKAATKPTYAASEVGAVPTSRKVNGKALTADVTLGAADVGAYTKAQTDAKVSFVSDAINWNESALSDHENNNANPHGVTAAQVGAYTKTQTDAAISSATGGLASVSSVASVSSALAAKADAATVNSSLALKADKAELAAVTNAVRETVRETGALFWDEELEVTWQGRFEGGYLYYVPVTNVNVTGRD